MKNMKQTLKKPALKQIKHFSTMPAFPANTLTISKDTACLGFG